MTGSYGDFTGGGQDHTIRCPSPQQNYPNTANANLAARPYKSWIVRVAGLFLLSLRALTNTKRSTTF